MWGEDGTRRSQPLQDRGRREGRWERKEMDERGKKRVWKWDERLGQLRGITAGQLCIYWSAAAGWFFCQSHWRKNGWKRGKKEKKIAVLCFSFSFSFSFFCLLPTCEVRSVWERSSWAHHTRDEHIQFAESLSCQRTSTATFSGRQELSRDLRAASRGAEAASNAGEAWDLVFTATAHLCRQLFYRKILWKRRILERRRVCKHVLTSGEGRRLSRQLSSWHPEVRMGCWNQDLQESRCGLGDEFQGGVEEGWGFSGWEGKKGLPLPRGTSACLHRHLPVNMQVLQIVKELVSPSRRRATARFGGVCAFHDPLSFYHSH